MTTYGQKQTIEDDSESRLRWTPTTHYPLSTQALLKAGRRRHIGIALKETYLHDHRGEWSGRAGFRYTCINS